jgi:hypothetical protein
MEVWRNEELYLTVGCKMFDELMNPQGVTMEIKIYDIPAIKYALQQINNYYPSVLYVTIADTAFVVTPHNTSNYREWISLVSYGILYVGKSWWEHWFGASLLEEDVQQSYKQLLKKLQDPEQKPSFGSFLSILPPNIEDMAYIESLYQRCGSLSEFFRSIHYDRRGIFNEWKLRSFFTSFENFHTALLKWKIPVINLQPEQTENSYSLIGSIESLPF